LPLFFAVIVAAEHFGANSIVRIVHASELLFDYKAQIVRPDFVSWLARQIVG